MRYFELVESFWEDELLLDLATRLGAAIVLGMVFGFERQLRDKPAGLRTMMLISIGACVFAIVSQKVQALSPSGLADPGRIAAQIVTGVGFLGAGSILRSQQTVYGLTTAAGIWLMAATGMACGFAMYEIAVLACGSSVLVIAIFQTLAGWLNRARSIQKYRLSTENKSIGFEYLDKLFKTEKMVVLGKKCYQEERSLIYRYKVRGHIKRHWRLREKLLQSSAMTLLRS